MCTHGKLLTQNNTQGDCKNSLANSKRIRINKTKHNRIIYNIDENKNTTNSGISTEDTPSNNSKIMTDMNVTKERIETKTNKL